MRETINDEADNEQNATKKNEKIKAQGFSKSFASNSAANNNSKKPISYRSYINKQVDDFISLIIEMASIKDAVSRTDIILSTAYRFRIIWNEDQEVLEGKKRNYTKKDSLKVERALFIVKPAGNSVLMTLEQMRENSIENYP